MEATAGMVAAAALGRAAASSSTMATLLFPASFLPTAARSEAMGGTGTPLTAGPGLGPAGVAGGTAMAAVGAGRTNLASAGAAENLAAGVEALLSTGEEMVVGVEAVAERNPLLAQAGSEAAVAARLLDSLRVEIGEVRATPTLSALAVV